MLISIVICIILTNIYNLSPSIDVWFFMERLNNMALLNCILSIYGLSGKDDEYSMLYYEV